MEPTTLVIPRPVPLQRLRPPKPNIPQTRAERTHFLQVARRYVAEFNPVPPLTLPDLTQHAQRMVDMFGCDAAYRDYVAILINNEMWRETVASVPYSRRLLLLPKCLRVEDKCPAQFDEFGLLCRQCGLCSIQDLQNEAERLGYAVLVAEGSALVMSLIQGGKIDAIVGVSCLNVLERAFPYMESAAIPGVAVPLLQDDCANTTVDMDWVWDYINLTSADNTRRLDLGTLRTEVEGWFSPSNLETIQGPAESETERIARDWLTRAGKRWRPFLTVAAYQALRVDLGAPLPLDICKVALAVECFHKASLIHDDIEDGDLERYGEKTLHASYGVPVALNVGDLLIGEGYRLIASSGVSSQQRAQMLLTAAQGQRQLCRGQGAELLWGRKPSVLSSRQVLDIFRRKTAPAFEVALRLGAIYASLEESEELGAVLSNYSEALGIAYQIRDDLDDWGKVDGTNDMQALRPSLLLAVAFERAQGSQKALIEGLWRRGPSEPARPDQVQSIYSQLKVEERTRVLLETYKEQAVRSLHELDNANLKGLLRRVIGRIFNDAEIKGWCREFQAKNAARAAADSGPASDSVAMGAA